VLLSVDIFPFANRYHRVDYTHAWLNYQRFLFNVYKRFFLFLSRFYVFNVFYYFNLNVFYIYVLID